MEAGPTVSSLNSDQLATSLSKTRKPRARKKHVSGNFIKGAISKPGSLHKALNVPLGQKIPAGTLAEGMKSTSPDVRKKARFAKELAGFGKK